MKRGERSLIAITTSLCVVVPLVIFLGIKWRQTTGTDTPQQCADLFIRGLKTRDTQVLNRAMSSRDYEGLRTLNQDKEWPNLALFDFAQKKGVRPVPDMQPVLQAWAAGIPDQPVHISKGRLYLHFGDGYTFGDETIRFEITRTNFGTWRVTSYLKNAVR